MVGIHVDDLFGCGLATSSTYHKLIEQLKASFNFKHWTVEGERPLEFCGCQLTRTATESVMTQADYLKTVKPMTCVDNEADRELSSKEQSSLTHYLVHFNGQQPKHHLTYALQCRSCVEKSLLPRSMWPSRRTRPYALQRATVTPSCSAPCVTWVVRWMTYVWWL